ncbi:D-alanyl-D-alanine carboxypeptidase DacF precursor [Desulfosporosinus acididurans]|uniref:D-alanyl-D-alanine carboxypeptidase DacF n=1 Tax=Desulfosporosinus acididurans TaxID=476652 RepID=A0A0J1ISP2_9FIRM|nr:D-alanyl-D-alanine carboxypeptidase [Desulfosporosinus acididurans]KLU67676.1 D-alanyl-D-alanine carboxypeptidase DacF precursor [Desulfosporosinus acididurans]
MSGTPSTSPSRKVSMVPIKGILVLLIAVLVCALAVGRYNGPLPTVEAKLTTTSSSLPGHFSVTFPEQGESAVGTENLGVITSTPNQSPVPIASVTKIMTAYLVLKTHPLQPGQSGPALTMSAQDFAGYQNALSNGYSYLKIEEGETLTEKQLLEGLLLPSGDNVADTLGRWVSGSDEAFVAKMNETAKSLGMTKTHYADASGVSETTVSTAVDQIKIAQAAMQDPVFRQIVAMPQATLPVAGTVYNVNSMVGKHGITGIKTGSTTAAGGCFVSATPVVAGDETHYIIGAVLGQVTQQSLQSALQANADILDQVRSQFKLYTLDQPASGYGELTTAWGSNSPLKASKSVQIFGYPGMKVNYSIDPQTTKLPMPANSNRATLKIKSGEEVQSIPLQNLQPINPPGFLWRLIRF